MKNDKIVFKWDMFQFGMHVNIKVQYNNLGEHL